MAVRKTRKTPKRSVRDLAVKAVERRPAEDVRGGDAATPKLREAACKGKHVDNIVIEF